jgi:serine/threonine protein phosphatase PrpC
MEDEFVVSPGGHFAAVFDGHGGASVSKYLRQNLYANLQAALPSVREFENSTVDAAEALRSAFEKVDREVQRISHWSFQGSTAVAILLHPSGNETFILAANVGDSRAVLSRGGMAVDLTRDHKPNDPGERARIEALGGRVEWCGSGTNGNGIHRMNGNLALSRAIGDRSERPLVSSKSDITTTPILPAQDEFIVIASDGLWDVMSSQDAISFVQDALGTPLPTMSEDPQDMERQARQIRSERKQTMSKRLTKEALRRGSSDNITVLIVWLKDSMTEEFVLQSR